MGWLRRLLSKGEEGAVPELSTKRMPFRWGPYTLLKHLGTDTLGETFVALETESDRPSRSTARDRTKEPIILRRGLVPVSSSRFLQIFLSDLNMYQQLNHPQICRLQVAGVHEGVPIIVSEHATGKRLSHLLSEHRAGKQLLTWPVGAYLAEKVCAALEYIHAIEDALGRRWKLSVFEVGLSPADIIVGYSGEVRLADLGLGPLRRHQERPMLPAGRSAEDSRRFWLSPEAVHGQALSQTSDVFCVGWLLWELATSRVLFEDAGELAAADKVGEAKVQPPRELNPALPPQLEAIILRALARDPADRFASAASMRRQLAAITDLAAARAELTLQMRSIFADDLAKTRDELTRWTGRSRS